MESEKYFELNYAFDSEPLKEILLLLAKDLKLVNVDLLRNELTALKQRMSKQEKVS